MWWTSDSSQSLIILCLGKYLSAKDIFKKLVPDPFNRYHEMRHNLAIHLSESNRILELKSKRQSQYSHSSLKILVLRLIFWIPDPSLYNHWKRPGTDKKIFNWQEKFYHCQLYIILDFHCTKFLFDSNKYLLSKSISINPLEPDVHHMTSQILSMLIDFLPRPLYHFSINFPIFRPLLLWNKKRYWKQ